MNKWTRPFEGRVGSASPAGSDFSRIDHQYFAFLSYSHKDSADADWLHRELERFRVPSALAGRLTATGVIPNRLTPIFRDRHELAAAHDLGSEIREALAASHCLIVLCSPAASGSKWTNAEIEEFKRVHPEGCIIAAIVGGEPFASEIPGREADECFPPALRQKYDRRGRPTGKRSEPLAADLREQGDGRRIGVLKIIAGMLGLGLDDLVQRDHLRRQRRLAGITVGSLGGMLIASTLAFAAVQSRDEARDQRREAESLVGFMVGDLKDKLEPLGRLDILDSVASKALAYYQKQDMSKLSDAGLTQRSQALTLLGRVASDRGDLGKAQQFNRAALAGSAEALTRSPDDPQRIFQHAQTVFWSAELARDRGLSDPADAAYREYKRLADRLVELEPDNLRWRMESVYGDVNIGIALRSQRRFAESTRQFEGAVRPMESIASLDPGNAEYQKELVNLLGWVADAQRSEGRLDDAIATRERQLALLQRLITEGMRGVGLRRHLGPANQALGILFAARDHYDRASEHLRVAVAAADRLNQIEPDNIGWKGEVASSRLALAEVLLALDRKADAAGETRLGCELAADVIDGGAGATWLPLQTNCLLMRSRLALASGAGADALRFAERALESARKERSGDPVKVRYSVAAAYRLLGDIRQGAGDTSGANAAWATGLTQIPPNVAEQPWEMYERAELLRRLGRASEAIPVAAKLAAMGYRSER